MPYDPAQPADHSELKPQVVRAQFNALNDKIDAVPAVPPVGIDAVRRRGHRPTR